MKPPFLITPKSVSIIYNGRHYIANNTHINFAAIREAIINGEYERIAELFDVKQAIFTSSSGKIRVTDDAVLYNDEPVHNLVAQRILDFVADGLNITPLVRFLERLMNNPSRHSVEQLYGFLEHKNLPIDEDGYIYAYKAVCSDYMDKHSRTLNNHPGKIVEIPRNKVDDDFSKDCSYGLHAGDLEYVSGFATGDDRIVYVKIDPADVVSVPMYDTRKLRTCKYEVIGDYTGPLPDTLVSRRLDEDIEDDDNWDTDCPCDPCQCEDQEDCDYRNDDDDPEDEDHDDFEEDEEDDFDEDDEDEEGYKW